MKRIVVRIIVSVVVLMMTLSSCRHDEQIAIPENNHVPEGYVSVCFRVDQSDMKEVNVRSVDPDGQDINTMKLFCFNAYGLFLATTTAELTRGAEDNAGHHTQGTYKAAIPEETSIIHFVANQNEALYQNEDFVNKTEAQVLAAMEGASGMMIYWRRFAKDINSNDDIESQLAKLNNEKGIALIRNQAKVTINDWTSEWTGGSFTVTGYVTANIHAFGTVAPFCPTHGFAIYEWPVTDGHYSVTLPENKAMMSDIVDINTKSEDYIFEHENTLDNPVSVIIKGKHNVGMDNEQSEDLYYRVMLMDGNGEMIPVLRNHHYKLNIVGPLSYGKPTFEEALAGPATNNVWVSVDSWVKEVADSDYKLTLTETSKVFESGMAGTAYSFTYTLTRPDGSMTGVTAPEISWLDGNKVARQEFSHEFDSIIGTGHISVTLLADDPNTPEQSGTLMIRKGKLYRTIDISMISIQNFTPSWIAAQVYGKTVGEKVTLKFTIPETCPESLFPFPVMVSVADLDVRASSGMTLPVRLESEASWYGDPNVAGYKYEYMVDRPGVHRLYFHSLLEHNNNETESVTIEANFFNKLTKQVIFVEHQNAIVMDLPTHTPPEGSDFAKDELIKYYLVPQKVNALAKFDMELKNISDGQNINAAEKDEFLLYSKSLDYYTGTQAAINGSTVTFDCEFGGVDEEIWEETSNGRVAAFRPRTRGADPSQGTGKYSVYMYTNKPVSEDVVRISSNVPGSKAYWNGTTVNENANEVYEGNTYRSTIFELANYRPFRFAAQVDDEGNWENSSESDVAEQEDEILWDYAASGKPVNISFDVTSFKSSTDKRSVDPFGTEFEIYIDAPMLEIDESRLRNFNLDTTKLKKIEEGRFVYKVDANRETERAYGTDAVKNVDGTGVSQAGERKTLPFKTTKVTSAGEITISSNKEKVVYYDKTFKVKNNLIKGTIQYVDASGNIIDVPANAFVAFVRKLTRARIGSVSVKSDGQYELNLRSEYTFYWTDKIEFDCKIDGVAYEYKVYDDNGEPKELTLEYLYTHPNVKLVVATSAVGN